MPPDAPSPPVATRLATHLARRRRRLLAEWRRRVAADPTLTTASRLSRTQFEDHVPQVLDAFEHRLLELDRRAPAAGETPAEEAAQSAENHGLHRWQQGYDQRETIREWHHLQMCLLEEIDLLEGDASTVQPDDHRGLSRARRELTALCLDGIEKSAARFMEMHRAEAALRLHDLERAMSHLVTIEAQRAAVLREAAHDLRGNVGTLRTVSTLLARPGLSEDAREAASGALYRGVTSLHALLNDLLDLSRLDAGLERRATEPFDAVRLLVDQCDAMQHVARDAGLFLRFEGPDTLPVEGDPIKIVRIVQNLALNALRCTARGGVIVHCEHCEPGSSTVPRWMLTVQDTGPGMPEDTGSAIARHLKEATTEAGDIAAQAVPDGDGDADRPELLASRSAGEAAHGESGEGLGLAIVKRLCELLDAGIDLETGAGKGTTFRIVFPAAYPD
jgi:signal transduction histidine kinase